MDFQPRSRARDVAAAVLCAIISSTPCAAVDLAALTENKELLIFDAARPAAARRLRLTGFDGTPIGFDYRPADAGLYALNRNGEIYEIDGNGAAHFVASMTLPLPPCHPCGFDFTPQADRLRLVGANGDNLRVHVRLGASARDRGVAYQAGDVHAGRAPAIAGVAYTRNVAKTSSTVMFNIDTRFATLVIQDPPNSGQMTTVGRLGVELSGELGFEISTTASGEEVAFLAHGGRLYEVDLATGAAAEKGPIGGGGDAITGLSIWPHRRSKHE